LPCPPPEKRGGPRRLQSVKAQGRTDPKFISLEGLIDVPITTVSAPLPEGTRPEIAAEMSAVLRKRVASMGLCRPGSYSVSAARFHDKVAFARRPLDSGEVDETDDPWFPVEETGDRAVKVARRACMGCPVKAECAVLAYREEAASGDINGVRGGLSAGERRIVLRRFRATDGGAL
jgi:Transcription factor WhiB